MAAKGKFLVVDDNEDNRELLAFRLRQLGYEIIEARNGKEAIETASQARPDLVFMDLKMPVMDGWEATRAMRQTDWGKELPIIAVTAHAMDEERNRALNAGCNGFITKPILDYSVIQRKIDKFLKGN
jgi:CheY-like chemotaxis protein